MFNLQIFKHALLRNWKMWTIITSLMCGFLIILTLSAGSIFENMPQLETSLTHLYIALYVGLVGYLLPLAYVVFVAINLVVRETDKGCIGVILATPVKRNEISFTRAVFLVASTFLMIATATLTAIIFSAFVSHSLDIGKFILINTVFFLLLFAISGICYFFSCLMSRMGVALAFGGGIALTFYIFRAFTDIESLSFFRYFTLDTLFSTTKIMNGQSIVWEVITLLVIGTIMYAASIFVFKKKEFYV